ncbi:hypothetical protein FHX81_5547 [Saccharothrix saharensis]|uniref:Uncharacterized protein n=1 Tax=Saccharothrix saharensis TaxID=571190 RepID=A0A543JJU1_9PSEU|nr:hypothetical protein FHX81_5547 [Saccharothrix saharensis]
MPAAVVLRLPALVVSLGNSPVALLVLIGALCPSAIVAVVRTVVRTAPKLSADQVRAWADPVAPVKGKGGGQEEHRARRDRPDPPTAPEERLPGKTPGERADQRYLFASSEYSFSRSSAR